MRITPEGPHQSNIKYSDRNAHVRNNISKYIPKFTPISSYGLSCRSFCYFAYLLVQATENKKKQLLYVFQMIFCMMSVFHNHRGITPSVQTVASLIMKYNEEKQNILGRESSVCEKLTSNEMAHMSGRRHVFVLNPLFP